MQNKKKYQVAVDPHFINNLKKMENCVLSPRMSPNRLKSEIHVVSPDSKAVRPSIPKSKAVDNEKTPLPSKPETGTVKTALELTKEVKNVYKLIQKSTGATGGNGYNGAIYGELTVGSMQKILSFLTESCELNQSSCFIDVGAGLGKPNFHVLQYPQVRLSVGVELEEIRWILSMHNLGSYLRTIRKDLLNKNPNPSIHQNHNINFICADIDSAISLDPFTHIYMYDLGFPPDLQSSIARKFNNSRSPKYLISYRPPRRVIDEYGYEVECIHQMNTKMFGSGESHMAYFYKRIGVPTTFHLQNQVKISLPISSDSESEVAYSDKLFAPAIQLMGDFEVIYEDVRRIVEQHLNCPRTTRSTNNK